MEWGPKLGVLQDIYRATGKKPESLQSRPQPRPEHRYYINAFFDLSPSRQFGMQAGPIPCSEVLAYCDLMGLPPGEERVRLLRYINALDGVYLELQVKKSST